MANVVAPIPKIKTLIPVSRRARCRDGMRPPEWAEGNATRMRRARDVMLIARRRRGKVAETRLPLCGAVWHPDRFVDDAGLRAKADQRLRQIKVAYSVLLDRAEPLAT